MDITVTFTNYPKEAFDKFFEKAMTELSREGDILLPSSEFTLDIMKCAHINRVYTVEMMSHIMSFYSTLSTIK